MTNKGIKNLLILTCIVSILVNVTDILADYFELNPKLHFTWFVLKSIPFIFVINIMVICLIYRDKSR